MGDDDNLNSLIMNLFIKAEDITGGISCNVHAIHAYNWDEIARISCVQCCCG